MSKVLFKDMSYEFTKPNRSEYRKGLIISKKLVMQQLLPNPDSISAIENKTIFLYFFKLKIADNDGSAIRQLFAQHQAKCLHWLHCE